MTVSTYGLIFNSQDDDPRPSLPSDLSVIGLVLPSDDANALSAPLNDPFAGDSGDPAFLATLGTGPLYKAVCAIDDQLADLQISARIVAVRVPMGATIDETIANIVGNRAQSTGLYALLKAGQKLGVVPRLGGAPGSQDAVNFTGHCTIAVDTVTITGGAGAGGQNYTQATVTFGPTGAGMIPATGHCTVANGKVTAIVVDTPGSWPKGTPVTVAIAGDGTGATASVTTALLANPICAALPEVLNAMLGHAVVCGPGTGEQDAIDWRETLNSRRLIPVDNWNIVMGADGVTPEFEDGAARVLGLGVRTDFIHAGYPFWSFAGQPIQNILGLKTYYTFSLLDGATEGQELLAQHIGVTERGEAGVETAIADSGFVFAGTFNADTDPDWWFYNKSRGRDWMHLGVLKSVRLRIGAENVTPHAVQAVQNDVTVINADAMANGGSIGFKVGFEAATNSATNLRQGKFRIFFAAEGPAPIMQVYASDDGPDNSKHLSIMNFKHPDFEEKTVDHHAGGALGAIAIGGMGFEALKASFKVIGSDPQTMALFGLGSNAIKPFTVYGLNRDKNGNKPIEEKAIIFGRLSKITRSEFKRGEGGEQDHEICEISHYEYYFNKRELYFYDLFASIWRVNGVNMKADENAILRIG